MLKCSANTEVYSRVVGFYRPVENWNPGKKQEWKDRKLMFVEASSNKQGSEIK
jgi:ribonucleoside-triphosphate reductase (formate)